MKTHKDMLDEKAFTACQAGHETHETEIVPTILGDMYAYKTELYMDFDGYCPGQDDISKTLKLYGVWEPIETSFVKDILENGDRTKKVMDIGAHTGWYSLMAAQAGYQVMALEADPENIKVLKKNAELMGIDIAGTVAPEITIYEMWIDDNTPTNKSLTDCELIIIDIEGNDDNAVRLCKDLFEKRKVANAMIEVSPVFNDRYPVMVDFIKNCGYKAWYADAEHKEFDDDYSSPQFNLLFVRDDENNSN